jgi:hypothetical protein
MGILIALHCQATGSVSPPLSFEKEYIQLLKPKHLFDFRLTCVLSPTAILLGIPLFVTLNNHKITKIALRFALAYRNNVLYNNIKFTEGNNVD